MRPLDNPPDFLQTVVLGGETMEVTNSFLPRLMPSIVMLAPAAISLLRFIFSMLQVAIPPRTWQSTVTAEHVDVRSYRDYGFNAARTRMLSQFTTLQMRACDFPKSGNDSATFGSGDAARWVLVELAATEA